MHWSWGYLDSKAKNVFQVVILFSICFLHMTLKKYLLLVKCAWTHHQVFQMDSVVLFSQLLWWLFIWKCSDKDATHCFIYPTYNKHWHTVSDPVCWSFRFFHFSPSLEDTVGCPSGRDIENGHIPKRKKKWMYDLHKERSADLKPFSRPSSTTFSCFHYVNKSVSIDDKNYLVMTHWVKWHWGLS